MHDSKQLRRGIWVICTLGCTMPLLLFCNSGNLMFIGAEVSFVEPISRRSRHAKQAVLFVQLKIKLNA